MTVEINLAGFNTEDETTMHGFHVHADGNVNASCANAGGHYNPENKNHGAPNATVR